MGDLALIVLVLLSVHHCETHGTWHKDVVVWVCAATIWALGVVLRVMRGALVGRLELLRLGLLRVLVAVVGHVSSVRCWVWTSAHGSLLIVAVEVLDVERAATLVVSKGSGGSWIESLVLCASPALSVEVLSQICVRRLKRVYYLWRSSTALESYLAVGLVEVVDVVLLLAMECGLSSVLALENLG